MTASGTCMPGTCVRIHSAALAERSGPTPTRMNTLPSRPSSSTWSMKPSKQRHVVAVLRLDELRAGGDLLGQPLRAPVVRQSRRVLGGAEQHPRREGDLAAAQKVMLVAQRARGLEQRHRVQVEHRLRLRMIAGLHAVAGEAQHVAHAHRGAAQDVALDGDAVLVAAGDLHDRRVADAREQRADGEARHVAVGAAAVGGVDGIDIAVEDARAPVDVLGIGGIRRRQLRGHRELPGAQHALEAARRGVARQDRQRVAGNRLVLEDHSRPIRFAAGSRSARVPRAATRSGPAGAGRPANCIVPSASTPPGMRWLPPTRLDPDAASSRASPRSCRWRARRRRVRCAGSSDSSSGRTCRSSSARTGRTCGSRTAAP